MLKNYLKIAARNLLRHRMISGINLMGLTIGITACLLILIYLLHELSYDKYNANAENIYRVTRTFNNQQGVVSLKLSTISPPFGRYLENDFPEIKRMTRLLDNGPTPLKYQEKLFNEKNVFYADEHLFEVFTLRVLKGNPQTALQDPFSLMLTPEMAKKYFGDDDPMNKVIRYNNQADLKVTGIFADFPANSHMHPGIMISFNTLKDTAIYGERNMENSWGNNSFFTFILLPAHYDPEKMISRFPKFIDAHMPLTMYNGKKPSMFTSLGLQKLTDIHLRSHTDYEAEENGDIARIYIFSAIALFILLIACINYMNLSTARSALRAREIGIRKVIGARRPELIRQFLSESVLISWMAMFLAVGLTYLTLPLLNKMSGLNLEANILWKWQVLVPVFLMPFVVGILSGIYPALFMSSFQPIKTLKGLFKMEGRSISFRKILVVIQFTISITLIITTAIVFLQLRYMQQKSLGYDKERILNVSYSGSLTSKYEAFRNALLQNSNIKEVTRSSRIPTGRLLDADNAYSMVGDSLKPTNMDIKEVAADQDFLKTYDIKMVAGRYYSRDYGTDTSSFVLNEAAISALGWKNPREAIGATFRYGDTKGKIIGVAGDFHFESLHQKIVPLVFLLLPENQAFYNYLSIKIGGQNLGSTMAYVEKTWKQFVPEMPYESNFLDEKFNKLYTSEERQGSIFTSFACIAIFIACLGLFGLSAFAITQRIKEIGIRKVLGASVSSIVSMLSADFLKLVLIASVIAFAVAAFSMFKWLNDFAYRISIPVWVFVAAALVASFVALATISFLSIKAALANPVKSLRSE